MQLKIERLIQDCDLDIRSGNIHGVRRRLQALNLSHIPRQARLELARICRRAGLVTLGIKILVRVVHPKNPREADPATHPELAEYAVLLTRAGALREAGEILAKVNSNLAPESLLYAAYTHFERWDFAPAIPKLEAYLKRAPDRYQHLIGKVNLAYAMVRTNQVIEAESLLIENVELANEGRHTRLMINCLELLTRLYVDRGDLDQASQILWKTRSLIQDPHGPESLLLRKWESIVSDCHSGRLEKIIDFRRELLNQKEWEHVRELDRYSLRIEFDRSRFEYLMFGTPYPSFRAQVCQETGRPPPSSSFVLGPPDSPCLDVVTGDIDNVRGIGQGLKCHQLIEILLRDFYRPTKLGQLFVELFPGQYFDIFSSPNRIYQTIFRAREWIRSVGMPVSIDEDSGYYSVRATGSFSFRVPYTKRSPCIYDGLMRELSAVLQPGEEVQPKKMRELLHIPRTKFFRFSTWALESGHLERVGTSSGTRYRLARAA